MIQFRQCHARVAFCASAMLLAGLGAADASAQWTDDPLLNTPVFVGAGDQVQPKIVQTSAGGSFISWFGNSGTGYDVFLQYLDVDGVPQWNAATTLIETRTFSSTQDYGLSIDSDDNALLVFRAERTEGIQIVAQSVDTDGMRRWGAAGLQLSADADFKASPKIVGLADGTAVAAFIANAATRVFGISSAGAVTYGPLLITDAPANAHVSDLAAGGTTGPAANGAWIMWVRQQGPTGARQLRVTAVNGVSQSLSAAPIELFTSGSLQFGNFPAAHSDGQGGMYTAWYTSSPLQCFAQRIDVTGQVMWQAGGLPVSTDGVRRRTDPSIHTRDAGAGYSVFWTETTAAQSQFGVYGQRISAAGAREWGDEGVVVVPLGGNAQTQVRCAETAQGSMTLWADNIAFGNMQIRAQSLAADGTAQWGGTLGVSTVVSSVSRQFAVAVPDGSAVITTWSDSRSDSGDIYAQRVTVDGALGGAAPIPGDLDGDGAVDFTDLLILLSAWGPCAPPCPPACTGDLNDDCLVDFNDLLVLLSNWS